MNTLTQSHYLAVDPIVAHCMQKSTPIWWAVVMRPDALWRAVMLAAHDWGLVDGLLFPWHGCAGHVGAVSFICRQPLTPRHTVDGLPLLGWLVHHLFEALTRVDTLTSFLSSQGALSEREIEVCQWAVEGKQISDIGRILGITAQTITFHLNRIVEKLSASNKNQAMSWVLKQGLVQLNVKEAPIINFNRLQSWQPSTDGDDDPLTTKKSRWNHSRFHRHIKITNLDRLKEPTNAQSNVRQGHNHTHLT